MSDTLLTAEHGPAWTDVTLTDVGGTNPVTLAALDAAASWPIVPPGTFSGTFVTAQLVEAFDTTDIRGKWVEWQSPAGAWNGVATFAQPTMSTATTEGGGRDWSFLLFKKRLAKDYRITAASAGAIVARVIDDTTQIEPLWIDRVEAEEVGPPLSLDGRADDALGVLTRLASESDQEWRVATIDGERVLYWRNRLGQDKSAAVQLVEGRHVIDFELVRDLEAVTNDLLAVPANAEYQRTNAIVVEDGDSIRALGTRMQGAVVVPDRISEASMRPVAEALLARLVLNGQVLTLTLTNQDRCWEWFDTGDTIRVLLPSINECLTYRIMGRAFDLRTGHLVTTGDVLT